MQIIKWLVFVGGVMAFSTPVSAQIEWNDSARLALGQCLVAEAGWRRRTEHAAISHVLARNWQRFVQRHPRATFEARVRQYCAVHRVRQPSPRQQWVRNLPWGPMTENPGMSPRVWRRYIDAWDFVRETVALFEAGDLEDPLPEARHWGGSMDGVPIGGILLARTVPGVKADAPEEEVQLHNRFYRIDFAIVRRVRAYQRAQAARDAPVPVSVILDRGPS